MILIFNKLNVFLINTLLMASINNCWERKRTYVSATLDIFIQCRSNWVFKNRIWKRQNTVAHCISTWSCEILIAAVRLSRINFTPLLAHTSFSTPSLVFLLLCWEGVCTGLWVCVSSTTPYTDCKTETETGHNTIRHPLGLILQHTHK